MFFNSSRFLQTAGAFIKSDLCVAQNVSVVANSLTFAGHAEQTWLNGAALSTTIRHLFPICALRNLILSRRIENFLLIEMRSIRRNR